ncbi:adenosylmethionine decarboxylase [Celerinatantimonas yamalensis]|uniref:Adenosylmethionine decarboxylase n=1 Tax=Celerinatantimonas yamalensis TaxID=559956 RepID=A0ABW9G6U2_9GAMM
MMFFEGSEKKIEIVMRPGVASLRALGREYWQRIVQRARADIISSVSNEQCDAYLLSESSLFVWDNRFLMLTCGTTTLVDAALQFISDHGRDALDFFSYQRKNEYQPHRQRTTVTDDLQKLREILPVQAHQLGYLDTHHHFLFHYAHPHYQPPPADITSELLMYHISEQAAQLLIKPQTTASIRQLLALDQLLPEFQLDDFVFDPFGYSVNAIRGEHYATIHITPQQCSSYVSFETNLDLGDKSSWMVSKLLDCLKPRSWDCIGFNSSPRVLNIPDYQPLGQCQLTLPCGYQVDFNYHLDKRQIALAIRAL